MVTQKAVIEDASCHASLLLLQREINQQPGAIRTMESTYGSFVVTVDCRRK